MSTFTKNSITVKGAVAIAALVAGGTLEFTRISVGDGNIPAGQTAMTMTDLANRLFDVDINEVYSDSESQATVTGVFNNSQTQTGFYYRELGLFAKDPATGAEILYCYGNAGTEAEWISPAGEESVIEKEVHIVTLVGNATEVTATLKSGIYPTIEQTQGWLAVKADLDATAAEGGRVLASQMRFDASQTLYVDAAASATGADGTEEHPFKTIQAAVNAAYAGADVISIKIKPGTYSEDVATPTARGSAWIFEKNGTGTVSAKSLKVDIAPYTRIQGLTFTPATGGIGIQLVSVPSAAIESNTITSDATGYGIYAARSGVRVNGNTINNAGHAVFASEASRVVAIGTAGTGNTNAFTADGSIIQCHGNNTITATNVSNTTNGGAINMDGAASTFPSSQGHLYSLGGFSTVDELKTRLTAEFGKLKEGDYKAFQFWNNITGNFGEFISSQTMHVSLHKTSNDGGGYGIAHFYAHRDAGAAYMQFVNGGFTTDTPIPLTKWQVISDGTTNVLELPTGIYSMINVTASQNLPDTQSGTLIVDKNVGSKHLTFYVDIEPKIYSRTQYTTGVWSDWVQYAPIATTAEYGLVKLADEIALLSEADDATLTVDASYELNDFRRMSTAYVVGDKVNCAFNFGVFLECTQAGTTSAETLDTRSVTHGQVISDGTVQWTVRTHMRSVNGVVPDATGNIPQSALGCLPLTGGTMTGSIVVKRHVLNTKSGASIYTAESDSELQICAGSNNYTEAGGILTLYSQSAAGDIKQGGFTLEARKGDDIASLIGTPDGTLFWNEKDVMRAYTPTSTQTDLGNIASETVLTAPDDGWMALSVNTNNSGITEVRISNETTGLNGYQLAGQTNNRWVTVTVPVSKGDQVRIYYGGANFRECKFIYARGAV